MSDFFEKAATTPKTAPSSKVQNQVLENLEMFMKQSSFQTAVVGFISKMLVTNPEINKMKSLFL
jgi:hypothetical protein